MIGGGIDQLEIRMKIHPKGRETVNTNLSAFSYGASTNKYSTGFNQSHAGDSSDSETGFLVHNSLIKFNDRSKKTLNR